MFFEIISIQQSIRLENFENEPTLPNCSKSRNQFKLNKIQSLHSAVSASKDEM